MHGGLKNQSSKSGSAKLQKAVAQHSVGFFQLCYRKFTFSAEIFNLTLSFFSETTKKISIELADTGYRKLTLKESMVHWSLVL